MKKLFIITMLLIVSCRMYSQEYYPLVGENKVWNVLMVYIDDFWPPFDTGYATWTYKFSGDTIINSLTYKKVYKTEEELPVNWESSGLIREDQDKKVWLKNFNIEEERLVYDFSVEPGDSVLLYLNMNEPCYLYVDSVFFTEINGMMRKEILLSYYNLGNDFKESWIEGVGSNRGIFQMGTSYLFGNWFWFSCLSENGQLVYMNPAIEDCYLFGTGINETTSILNRISIFPNPATTFITIHIKEGIAIEEAIIYNHLGQKALVAVPVNNTVDVSGLQKGMYILEITTNEGKYRKKLVID